MAKFICCYSGLEITTSHFPMYLSARERHAACHPIFYMPQKSLLSYARRWSANELTKEDAYLLFLALLKSTDLVQFRVAAQYIPREVIEDTKLGILYSSLGTDSIVAANMESLMHATWKINSLYAPAVKFPGVVISEETNSLWNAYHWIKNWHEIYKNFTEGRRRQETLAEDYIREQALIRMIRTPHKRVETYADDLALWADTVCGFPTYDITTREGEVMPLNQYYIKLIVWAARKEYFNIPNQDLYELIETCEEGIEFSIDQGKNAGGSVQSFTLFKILAAAKSYLAAFITGSSVSVKSAVQHIKPGEGRTFSFPDEPKEFVPGLAKLVEETPEKPPNRFDFASQGAYIAAKIKWAAACTARAKAVTIPVNPLKNSLGF